ncbi:hypothetical protein BRD20_11110 [Halobacteriales archaeon SW_8_65_20]|nr:MAG: hypothetical protein BRD20_11110 [Halobacteriales archaeon SW_8_65_20]
MDDDEADSDVGDSPSGEIPSEEEILTGIEDIRLTPSEHQRIKDLVTGREMQRIKQHDRRYLIAGASGETGAATRRELVYEELADRDDAVSMQLEEFGLTPEAIKLWIRVFDILCGRATHIVGVIEDFDGGYVWELGLLFAPSYRRKTWILKRAYTDEATERARFDNGMAASHVELLLTDNRCCEWTSEPELRDCIEAIP